MFIDAHDSQRKEYGLGSRKAEACVAKNCGPLNISMPALGEAMYKQYEKNKDGSDGAYVELKRLIDLGFFKVKYLGDSSDTFRIAKEIMDKSNSNMRDERDRISPMDVFILASAISDENSSVFYTSDDQLLSGMVLGEIVAEQRDDLGFNPLRITDISPILRN